MGEKTKESLRRVKGRHRPRARTAMMVVLVLLASVMAITAGTANAGDGGPSALGVQPVEVSLGGQPNDCSASISGRLPSAATYELRIENPQDGATYQGIAGVSITLSVSPDDKILDFAINGPAVVFDVVIKGGQKSTHYDYDGNGGPGGATADQNLHAPTKGNGSNAFAISHTSFCYEDAYPASGTVFVDDDQDGIRDAGEGADVPRVITAYGPSTVSTTSAADGGYILFLEAGQSYTICEEAIADFVQTAPSGNACAALGTSEDGGHAVTANGPQVNLDFGNAPEICGQLLFDSSLVFEGDFELFDQGNDEVGCDNKIGQLSVTDQQVNLPLSGPGEVAGIGLITKQFDSPDDFEPLTYSRTANGTYVVLPWCGLRAKVGADGNQFDPYLDDDSQYPSLSGITDAGGPSVSCKVAEDENAEGRQITVVLIQDDPFWR